MHYTKNKITPFRRFFARHGDWLITLFIFYFFLEIFKLLNIGFSVFFSILLSISYEIVTISLYGSTLCKHLFGIKILNKDGSKLKMKQSLKRWFLVHLKGIAFYIPILSFITSLVAFFRLRKRGFTSWDEDLNIDILIKPLTFVKVGIFFTVFLLIYSSSFYSIYQKEAVKVSKNEKINIDTISSRSKNDIVESIEDIYKDFEMENILQTLSSSKYNKLKEIISLQESLNSLRKGLTNQKKIIYFSKYSNFLIVSKNEFDRETIGSGFAVTQSLIVTNYHVVETAKFINNLKGVKLITSEKKIDVGFVLLEDKKNDLAIIKSVRGLYKPMELGDYRKASLGDEIFVISSPQGLVGTLSKGLISSKREEEKKKILQTTAPISEGSSGSPVLSKDLKVIGINRALMKNGQNINFAIPVSYLKTLIQSNQDNLSRFDNLDFFKNTPLPSDQYAINHLNPINKKRLYKLFDSQYFSYLEFTSILKLAKQGEPEAQYHLALIFDREKRYVDSFKWLKKSAHKGHADSQALLGSTYLQGYVVEKNYGLAYAWNQVAYLRSNEDIYKKRAEQIKISLTPSQFQKYHNYSKTLYNFFQKRDLATTDSK
ncbi:MAG: trypsin-like peptidase domain-containing protein [Bdellovibrionales bacterium]|nr:trypsin-like peptidase domain-containing protein [Bdellovibrionales bacterium]